MSISFVLPYEIGEFVDPAGFEDISFVPPALARERVALVVDLDQDVGVFVVESQSRTFSTPTTTASSSRNRSSWP